jgi:TonB family protein
MTGNPASVGVLALAGCLACLTMMTMMTAAGQTLAPPAGHAAEAVYFRFDIPAQPLAAALDLYAAASGRPVLFRSALAAGLMSFPVQGKYTADAALHTLLQGTGLEIDDVGNAQVDAFVLKPAGESVVPDVSAATPASASALAASDGMSDYDGQVQTRIWRAFCDNPVTRPGSYRALLRFGIDAAGYIGRARLLSSSGDDDRDADLLRTLKQVRVGPPPPEMAQPLTMLILPRALMAGPACTSGAR